VTEIAVAVAVAVTVAVAEHSVAEGVSLVDLSTQSSFFPLQDQTIHSNLRSSVQVTPNMSEVGVTLHSSFP